MVVSKHDFKLFVSPRSCARVPTIALEELEVPFKTELVRMNAKQHKSPEYLKINPKGKVPALVIDGKTLTENVAILTWLHRSYPEGKLLPLVEDNLLAAGQIADLAYISATMHPFVTRYARPFSFVTDEQISLQVREQALKASTPHWSIIDARLGDQEWWYGSQWSVVDGYIFWVWDRICMSGFPSDKFPNIRAHELRMRKRPSVSRALVREEEHIEVLKGEGLYISPS